MLDQTTKRKLDSARQILVGKVPDPKAQVEQITTALIYKFMDDMDKENEEVGLKTQFFVDDWKKFSWTKILDNKLSGQERLDLYVQAITNMPKNPHIPQLFRNIFKGAFLPYNDARTLSLFLKEINEFNYEHSENLGNAFEYLLSILGSQGDAGQFRTPRHIIDFMVDVVDPKKNETILDPACGTAGFLISAYKHILKQNKEKALTPDEKLKLMNNLAGYDISPDMVKLALVNMYLHGFPEPKIHEYDTLSSEKRWDETFDVIMANPPFMSPKGGIVPHNRFQIQANKAEVLFTDYILEHLNINGRAGIIVPEGIIFQTGKAYSGLRKLLLEKGLWSVVSLPVGVFNPYTKTTQTSILFVDKTLQKRNTGVVFIKVKSDGFDLGAERFPISENDLPEVVKLLNQHRKSTFIEKSYLQSKLIPLKDLFERSEVNFAVFNEVEDENNSNFQNIKIGEILKQQKNTEVVKVDKKYKQITVKMNGKGVILRKEIQGSNIKTKTQFIASTGDFIISKIDARNGAFGIVPTELNGAIVTSDFPLFRVDHSVMLPDFLNIVIQSSQFIKICQLTSVGTSNRRRVKLSKFLDSRIPLPTLKEQKKFLDRISGINSEILDLEEKTETLRDRMSIEVENIWTS
ncbi:MAG: N-6 DNA methylase [Patescibacteria group bacterium]